MFHPSLDKLFIYVQSKLFVIYTNVEHNTQKHKTSLHHSYIQMNIFHLSIDSMGKCNG